MSTPFCFWHQFLVSMNDLQKIGLSIGLKILSPCGSTLWGRRCSRNVSLYVSPAVCHVNNLLNCDQTVFLNKCDLLEKKLQSGIKVKKYIPRYGDRENTKDTFGKCLYSHTISCDKEYAHIHTPKIFEKSSKIT